MLSKAGKEILIKAVVQAIPIYIMSIFRSPNGTLDEIHSMMAKFWWGSSADNQKSHWHSWSHLCMPKKQGVWDFLTSSV